MSSIPAELTEAEWIIIKCIWELEPCTAPAVQERLFRETSWTYSTVRTLMDRMVAKGLLTAAKEGKMTVYRSATTRAQAQRGELMYALKHAFNNAMAPLVQCLLDTKKVSRAELDELKALIARHEAGGEPEGADEAKPGRKVGGSRKGGGRA